MEQNLKALCGSPAAARKPAWKINHILWKFSTFLGQMTGTSVFRIAMLFLNKQEERPFISNYFQTTRIFFCSVCLRLLSPQSYGEGSTQPIPISAHWAGQGPWQWFHGCKQTDLKTQRWEIKYVSMSVCCVRGNKRGNFQVAVRISVWFATPE